MAVSPDQLRALRFDESMRGYDKRQVDKVIARVADLVEELQGRPADVEAGGGRATAEPAGPATSPPSEASTGELDETLRRTLILAQRTADAAVKEARDDATRIRAEAEAEAEVILGEARARAERLGAEADEGHARSVVEADAERSRLLSDARQRAEARIAEVEAELAASHGAVRAELADQITQLTQVRDLLADDIERLEGHLARRRQQVRAALDEVAAVLDDPDKLHAAETPGLEPVEPPPADGYQAVAVKVQALEDLEGELEEPDHGVEPGSEPEQPSWVTTPAAVPPLEDGVSVDDGPPTAPHPVVTADADQAGQAPAPEADGAPEAEAEADDHGRDDEAGPADDEPARPAWADAVPPAGADERPATSVAGRDAETEAADSGAMDRFFGDHGEDDRRGWFRRRA